jgi:tetratricopeptide (TPR) repeat protein
VGELVRRGERLLESGAVSRAEQVFKRALQIDQNEPRALTGLGYVEIEKNSPSKAILYFQPAAGQGYAEAYIGLGDAYRQLGRKTDALRAYETYVRNRPRGHLASIARAQIEQYRIEMRKKAEQHKLEAEEPSAPGPAGP